MSKIIALIALFSIFQSGNEITHDELLGKFEAASHPDFIQIESEYTSKSNIYMRRQAYGAFEAMHFAAATDGVNLPIISATRSFSHQKRIWEGKWQRTQYMGWSDFKKAKDIMTYSSMPGTSRHHWGTDIDLISLNNDHFANGKGLAAYEWLKKHAHEYGFGQTYTSKDSGRTGYEEEKWHWSYLVLSKSYLETYLKIISSEDIKGFSGQGIADSLDVIPHYVNGIDSSLRNY